MNDQITVAIAVSIFAQLATIVGGWQFIKSDLKATTARSLENANRVAQLAISIDAADKVLRDYREEEKLLYTTMFNDLERQINEIKEKIDHLDNKIK